jgi:hypothetical protein
VNNLSLIVLSGVLVIGIVQWLGTGAGIRNVVGKGSLKLDVLLVYEDAGTGLRAKQALDQTMLRLAVDTDVHVNAWRFELLREPALHQQAVNEAAEAEIVFFSAHGSEELPATVSLWFQHWLARRGGEPCALVVSLDTRERETPTANQMVVELSGMARRAGVDVFLHLEEAQVERVPALEEVQRRAELRTALLGEILRQAERHSYRDCGINE